MPAGAPGERARRSAFFRFQTRSIRQQETKKGTLRYTFVAVVPYAPFNLPPPARMSTRISGRGVAAGACGSHQRSGSGIPRNMLMIRVQTACGEAQLMRSSGELMPLEQTRKRATRVAFDTSLAAHPLTQIDRGHPTLPSPPRLAKPRQRVGVQKRRLRVRCTPVHWFSARPARAQTNRRENQGARGGRAAGGTAGGELAAFPEQSGHRHLGGRFTHFFRPRPTVLPDRFLGQMFGERVGAVHGRTPVNRVLSSANHNTVP